MEHLIWNILSCGIFLVCIFLAAHVLILKRKSYSSSEVKWTGKKGCFLCGCDRRLLAYTRGGIIKAKIVNRYGYFLVDIATRREKADGLRISWRCVEGIEFAKSKYAERWVEKNWDKILAGEFNSKEKS